MNSFQLVVSLGRGGGGCSGRWVPLGGWDTFPRLRLSAASPYQVPVVPTSLALRLTAGVFYHAISLMRDG